ncbi:MAG: hypothetical protein AB7S38_30300 [Vulcanimicrobiota bacterium]
MATTMVLDSRFNGPADSANGGYTCGRLAAYLSGPVEVTLRVPPPLGVELQVEQEGDCVRLLEGNTLVAEARPATLELVCPPSPGLARAQEAAKKYVGHDHHPFPTCFVCGPGRPEHEGLRIFAGPIGGGKVAAPWTPDPGLGRDGFVRPEFLWCALDCPGAFAVEQSEESPRVLGRLVASLEQPLPVAQPAVVVGWSLGVERRKAFAGTAIYDQAGKLCARARATWIALQ